MDNESPKENDIVLDGIYIFDEENFNKVSPLSQWQIVKMMSEDIEKQVRKLLEKQVAQA